MFRSPQVVMLCSNLAATSHLCTDVGALQHIALASDWDAAQSSGSYEISTRDRSLAEEGFIHLAFPHQLDGVVSRFYADVTEALVVLEIDPSELDSAVVVEPGDATDPGSERFPHLYGALPVRAVVGVAQLGDLPQRATQHEPQTAENDDP